MLTKMVDGKVVEVSEAEEVDLRAFWAANDPAKLPPESTQAQRLVAQILADPQALALLKKEIIK